MLTRVVRAVALLAFVAVAAGAQRSAATSKGAWLISGGVSFSQQSGDLYENGAGDGITNIAILPNAGFFVMPGLLIGASVVFDKSSQGDDSQSLTGFGPMVSYYFDGGGSMIPYVGGRYEIGKLKSEGNGFSSEQDGTRMVLGGGILLRRGHLGIAIELGYIMETVDVNGTDVDGNTLAIGVGLVGLLHR
jgi:hypothetical protein